MSTQKSVLKRQSSKTQKVKKNVVINLDKNEGFIKKPHPITPISKSELWTTALDEHKNRQEVRRIKRESEMKERNFLKARKNVPFVAAQIASGRYKTGSTPSPRESEVIELKKGIPLLPKKENNEHASFKLRNVNEKNVSRRKGAITTLVDSVFRFFGKKGGRKTRKNNHKKR
jgi:hypothetical protein